MKLSIVSLVVGTASIASAASSSIRANLQVEHDTLSSAAVIAPITSANMKEGSPKEKLMLNPNHFRVMQAEDDDLPSEIVGGTPLDPGVHPYLVSIGFGNFMPTGHSCGGSLIAPNAVLTAAHCFNDEKTGDFSPKDWVEFNRYDRTNFTGVIRKPLSQMEGVGTNYVQRHPGWDTATIDNDFAVICLEEPVDGIDHVTLNSDQSLPADNTPLEVFGWGRLSDGGPLPNVPHTITTDYVPNQNCSSSPFLWAPSQITSNMLCAYEDGKSSCQGDSGGPIISSSKDGPIQVGVTSFGPIGCNVTNVPSVYARVSAGLTWIEAQVERCTPSTAPTTSPTTSPTSSSSPTSITTSPTSSPSKMPTTSPSKPFSTSPTGSPTVSPSASSQPTSASKAGKGGKGSKSSRDSKGSKSVANTIASVEDV